MRFQQQISRLKNFFYTKSQDIKKDASQMKYLFCELMVWFSSLFFSHIYTDDTVIKIYTQLQMVSETMFI